MHSQWVDFLQIVVPVLALALALVLSVTFVLTRHQQRMAAILNRSSDGNQEIGSLRKEIAELRAMLVHHIVSSDSSNPESVAERLSAGVPQ